jgi:uncharacterized protein YcbX
MRYTHISKGAHMTTNETAHTPITDRLEALIEKDEKRDVPVRVWQTMRALEADRTELVAVLARFASLDKTVNSDTWAIDAAHCARARKVIEGLFKG